MVATPDQLVWWTDERVAELRRLWMTGLSCRQIAKQLGATSRSAVCGKAHRLGLKRGKAVRDAINKLSRKGAGALRAAQERTRTPRENRAFSRIAMTPAVVPVVPMIRVEPPPRRHCEEAPGPNACTLEALTSRSCRWPIGDPRDDAFRFCGEDAGEPTVGRPQYCAKHAKVAFQPAANGKKRSGAELARSLRRWAA